MEFAACDAIIEKIKNKEVMWVPINRIKHKAINTIFNIFKNYQKQQQREVTKCFRN